MHQFALVLRRWIRTLACPAGVFGGILLGTAAGAAPVYNTETEHYYEAIPGAITWDAARIAAQSRSYLGSQGYLATITSAAENAFIVSKFPEAVTGGYWLGGSQPDGIADPNAGWTWVTGEEWSYTNWSFEEPNDWQGVPENRLQFYRYDGTGHWNDVASTGPYGDGYVVEYPSIPEHLQGYVTLPPLSPTLEGKLISVQETSPTSILFVNKMKEPVRLFWLDYLGQRQESTVIEPGGQWLHNNTYVMHPWLVTDLSGNGIVAFLAESQPGLAIIKGKGGTTNVNLGTGLRKDAVRVGFSSYANAYDIGDLTPLYALLTVWVQNNNCCQTLNNIYIKGAVYRGAGANSGYISQKAPTVIPSLTPGQPMYVTLFVPGGYVKPVTGGPVVEPLLIYFTPTAGPMAGKELEQKYDLTIPVR